MAFRPDYLASLHGRLFGMSRIGEFIGAVRDQILMGLVFANAAASAAVTNTVTETAFSVKYTLPKNLVRAGTRLKVRFQGIATSTNATDTLAIKLYIGGITGTALLSLAARDVANNDIFAGEAEVIFRTIGATGTFVAWGMSPTNPNAQGTALNMNSVGSTTIDTTADKDIAVSATWSVASASNSCRLDMLTVELA